MDEGGFLVDLAAASSAADQELAGALKALEAARAEAEARRLVAGTAPRKLADDVAPLDEGNRGLNLAIGQRQTLVTRWLEGGMSGEPDPARLTTLIDGVSNRLQTLTAMMERQRQLTARYRRWTQDEALRNVRRRIVDEVAGATPPERSERLHWGRERGAG